MFGNRSTLSTHPALLETRLSALRTCFALGDANTLPQTAAVNLHIALADLRSYANGAPLSMPLPGQYDKQAFKQELLGAYLQSLRREEINKVHMQEDEVAHLHALVHVQILRRRSARPWRDLGL